jgi:hypothetical protein
VSFRESGILKSVGNENEIPSDSSCRTTYLIHVQLFRSEMII